MLEFDEKGKFFTEIVRKEPILALICLPGFLIKGQVYIHPDKRIKDELDAADDFLPVTDAEVQNEQGLLLYRTEFVAINKQQILWVIPVAEMTPHQEG